MSLRDAFLTALYRWMAFNGPELSLTLERAVRWEEYCVARDAYIGVEEHPEEQKKTMTKFMRYHYN